MKSTMPFVFNYYRTYSPLETCHRVSFVFREGKGNWIRLSLVLAAETVTLTSSFLWVRDLAISGFCQVVTPAIGDLLRCSTLLTSHV
jgi:hypothetical protein